MNHRIAVSILTSFPNFGERFYSKKLRQPLPARGPEDEPRIFQTPSIERGSFRALTNQNNTEGAPGSSLEPGSWGCFSLLTLPRRSPPAPLIPGKTPNCSTANLSGVSPVRESPDSRACNSTFLSSFLRC